MITEKNIGKMRIAIYEYSEEKMNAIYIYSYNTMIGFFSSNLGFISKAFYSQQTRRHQGLASQILSYAKAKKWDYIRNAVKSSKTFKDLKNWFGYTYNKKYITFD